MSPTMMSNRVRPTRKKAQRPIKDEVQAVLMSLKRRGTKQIRDNILPRYGIHTDDAFGRRNLELNAAAVTRRLAARARIKTTRES